MKVSGFRVAVLRTLCLSVVCMGFAQVAPAGMIDTGYLVNEDLRDASLARVEVMLAREDVARQLAAMGVEREQIAERLQGLSAPELLALEDRLDREIAGGSALGVIGAVFLVLLILELLDVTDVFKAI